MERQIFQEINKLESTIKEIHRQNPKMVILIRECIIRIHLIQQGILSLQQYFENVKNELEKELSCLQNCFIQEINLQDKCQQYQHHLCILQDKYQDLKDQYTNLINNVIEELDEILVINKNKQIYFSTSTEDAIFKRLMKLKEKLTNKSESRDLALLLKSIQTMNISYEENISNEYSIQYKHNLSTSDINNYSAQLENLQQNDQIPYPPISYSVAPSRVSSPVDIPSFCKFRNKRYKEIICQTVDFY